MNFLAKVSYFFTKAVRIASCRNFCPTRDFALFAFNRCVLTGRLLPTRPCCLGLDLLLIYVLPKKRPVHCRDIFQMFQALFYFSFNFF